jgi:hypothetical protein
VFRITEPDSDRSTVVHAAAIDLNTQMAEYWLWNPRSPYRNRIPAEVVDIFEKHGFIWGGKGAFRYHALRIPARATVIGSECSQTSR